MRTEAWETVSQVVRRVQEDLEVRVTREELEWLAVFIREQCGVGTLVELLFQRPVDPRKEKAIRTVDPHSNVEELTFMEAWRKYNPEDFDPIARKS